MELDPVTSWITTPLHVVSQGRRDALFVILLVCFPPLEILYHPPLTSDSALSIVVAWRFPNPHLYYWQACRRWLEAILFPHPWSSTKLRHPWKCSPPLPSLLLSCPSANLFIGGTRVTSPWRLLARQHDIVGRRGWGCIAVGVGKCSMA